MADQEQCLALLVVVVATSREAMESVGHRAPEQIWGLDALLHQRRRCVLVSMRWIVAEVFVVQMSMVIAAGVFVYLGLHHLLVPLAVHPVSQNVTVCSAATLERCARPSVVEQLHQVVRLLAALHPAVVVTPRQMNVSKFS